MMHTLTPGANVLRYTLRQRFLELAHYLAFGVLPVETLNDVGAGELELMPAIFLGGGDA